MQAFLISSILPLMMLGALPSNNKGKIEGTKWSSIGKTINGNFIPAGSLKLEFGKDGSLNYFAGPKVFKGTYSLGKGDKVTLKLTEPLAGRKPPRPYPPSKNCLPMNGKPLSGLLPGAQEKKAKAEYATLPQPHSMTLTSI